MRLALIVALFASLPVAGPGLRAQSARAAIDAARAGGVIIVCRHAATDHSRDDAAVVDYADRRTQRLLSPQGEQQARSMGDAFRALGIDVREVIASPMDRARRSAELMFGHATVDSLWHTNDGNYGGERQERRRRVVATRVDRGVRVIVSHIVTITSAVPEAEGALREGDCIVVRPTGSSYHVEGVVRAADWSSAWSGSLLLTTAFSSPAAVESPLATSAIAWFSVVSPSSARAGSVHVLRPVGTRRRPAT